LKRRVRSMAQRTLAIGIFDIQDALHDNARC
jgi:hypothetical protein